MSHIRPSQRQLEALVTQYQTGRFSDAIKLATSLTVEFPDHELGWKVLGAALKQTGRIEESLVAKKKSVELAPEDAEAHNSLGITLQDLGKLIDAEASFRHAIALKPNLAEAHNNLGITLQEARRLDEAAIAYKHAIKLKTDFAEAYCNLGAVLQALGKQDEAISACRNAISASPAFSRAFNNLGIIYFKTDRLDLAEKAYRRAIAIEPDYAEAHCNLGVTLQALGRLDQAESSFLNAISIRADYTEAYRCLTSVKRFQGPADLITQMMALHADERLSEVRRSQICFALAKALEDLHDFHAAFLFYTEGNKLRRKLLEYDGSKEAEFIEKLKISYQRMVTVSAQIQAPTSHVIPIFVVGMPRSGTTLAEQIISSHSKVTGAGELPYVPEFGNLLASGASYPDERELQSFRQQYLHALKDRSAGKRYVTDKLPFNFRYLGLISVALPEAKIVNVRRDPAAVCWANYKKYFESGSAHYCYDLEDTVRYYRLYEDIMQFWNQCFPNRIYELNYDKLTVNQEEQIAALLDALQLDWESGCLSPESNKRNVVTASNSQIRQPIYKGSSEHWKVYQPYLGGVLDRLDKISKVP